MTDPVELDATLTQLVRRLCDAGELDVAVSLIDFLKLQGATGKSLLPLRAHAFVSEEVPLERKREVLKWVRVAMIDALARMGALTACAGVYKLLAEVFPDDRIWRRKLRRVDLVLSPLPGADTDPERRGVTELLVAGRAHDGLSALRAVARKYPEDSKLQQRLDELKNLLFEPSSTRPYRVLSPEEADRLSIPSEPPPAPEEAVALRVEAPALMDPAPVREAVLAALLTGDLSRAEPAVRTLATIAGDEVSMRLAEAIGRLAAIQRAETASSVNEEITMRLSPEATVDLWIRQGMLSRALDQARELLGRPENKDSAAVLSLRLSDLECLLATIPSPTPVESAATREVARADAAAVWEPPPPALPPPALPPPPDERSTTEFVVLTPPVSLPPEAPAEASPVPPAVSSTEPPTVPPPSSTKLAKRKVVRLG